MAEPLRITSLQNPRVKRMVKLRGSRERRESGLFIAEGRRELTRAVDAGLHLREIWVCPKLLSRFDGAQAEVERIIAALPGSVKRVEVSAAVFRKVGYLREPEGVLAVVEQHRWTLADLAELPAEGEWYLVAVGIEKPGNLGAMVRSAEAAGCRAVLAAGAAVDIFNPNTIRTSTCAVFSLPVVEAEEAQIRDWLLDRGIRLAATTPAGAVAHTRADLAGRVAIVIGAEDVGLSGDWLAAADASGGARVVIPMRGEVVDSLNASTAAAILLFEARRQRSG